MNPLRRFPLFSVVSCSAILVTPGFPADLSTPAVSTSRAESPSAPTTVVAPYQDTSRTYSSVAPSSLGWRSGTWSDINNSPFIPYASGERPAHSLRILFPAVPPVLGDPLPRSRIGSFHRNDLEAELSSYTNEVFYAPLSGLFTEEDLSHKRRERLAAFRALQARLVAELRTHIESLRDAPSDLRHEEFARLAAQQAPDLASLEVQAESLRSDFVRGGFFSTGINWNDTRDWRLGDDVMFESRQDEARVVRAAAYFQEGLSPGQRQLLRELAIELSEPIGQPTAGLELDQPKSALFFSPATARFRLPYNLPTEVAEKVEAYTAEKAALKRELREVIYAKDHAWLNLFRTRALRDLAQKQASRIAALDMQAEEIREHLALLPAAVDLGNEEIPAALGERIRHYLVQKQSVENAYLAKLGEARAVFARDRLEFDRPGGISTISYIPSRSTVRKTSAAFSAAQEDLTAFNLKQTALMRELEKEKEAIQNEVAAALRQKHPLLNHLPVDAVLRDYGKIFEWQTTWLRYGDYQTAVLEPGLSPAQRRLLYGAALETLRLPPTQ